MLVDSRVEEVSYVSLTPNLLVEQGLGFKSMFCIVPIVRLH